jgi:glycosyltransferase involved in cell wall biosynthesis
MTIPARDRDTLLSVVVPCLNESSVIDMLFEHLLPELEKLGTRHEIICVDNGSTDDSLGRLLAWRSGHPEIKVISLSRYFGKEAALTAGIDHAAGDAVVLMDPDLQDPPELLPGLVEKWREGFDVVYATRRTSGIETRLRRMANAMFYKLFNFVSEVPIPRNTGDFRLLDRRVVDILRSLPERARFLRALSTWVGFRSTPIFFDRPARSTGESKSTSLFLWGYALEAIMSSTTRPLRIWTYVGSFISAAALFSAFVIVLRTAVFGREVPGFASTMVAILLLSGFQLISIGVVAEYVGRIYREVQGRPLYLVDRMYGLEPTQRDERQTPEVYT